MATYAAVISLKQTMERLAFSSRISFVHSYQEIVGSAYVEVCSLQKVLERWDSSSSRKSSERMKALEGEMREIACKLEGVIESQVSNQILSHSETESLAGDEEGSSLMHRSVDVAGDEGSSLMHRSIYVDPEEATQEINCFAHVVKIMLKLVFCNMYRLNNYDPIPISQSEIHQGETNRLRRFSIDLQGLRQDIDCFTQKAKKLQEEYSGELDNPLPEEEGKDDEDDASVSSKMVGLTDQYHKIRDSVIFCPQNKISIVGMAGIGKTTLAKKLFEDPLILRHFECRAFVRVGRKNQLKQVLRAILAQVNPDSDEMIMEGDEKLDEYFYKSLNGRRYFIVLDDVWDLDFWDDFKRLVLPKGYEDIGRKIMVTTRRQQVVTSLMTFDVHKLRFLNKEESWYLLREKVFGEELCPSQLEKAGKKIAENCEGLPLLILTVANLLWKANKTPEYWNKVAADKENPIFIDAYDQISKVLYPSYNYLPQYLKSCFLYMGAFPQNCQVHSSTLINLWRAEGFFEPNPSQRSEDFAMECLKALDSSSLVVVHQQSLDGKRVKVCSLHSVCWHLCKREAGNNKFLHTLNSHADSLAESMERQRRLSIYKNILFSIKDVYNSMASISTALSLLCTGPHHQYQVQICFSLKLLRVLNALTIRFYDFPIEVLKLVQLRYLSLTCNGNIPPSISKLWNLEYLIVHQHLSIKSTVDESYLPIEIWDLQELKHLQIKGRNLPDPCGVILPNLLTLLDVGPQSCTKGVLESIPNLEKFRVQVELGPDFTEPVCCFDHISHLYKLRSFRCVVVNPQLGFKINLAPPSPLSIFTSNCLRKLTLSGFGYPWKDMSKIVELPYLRVLKLQNYAFRGEKWEVEENGLSGLMCLLIEDTDLVEWTGGDRILSSLHYLIIRHCYKLQKIPYLPYVHEIQLVDCNPSVVTCAKQIKANHSHVFADSSWDDGNLMTANLVEKNGARPFEAKWIE